MISGIPTAVRLLTVSRSRLPRRSGGRHVTRSAQRDRHPAIANAAAHISASTPAVARRRRPSGFFVTEQQPLDALDLAPERGDVATQGAQRLRQREPARRRPRRAQRRPHRRVLPPRPRRRAAAAPRGRARAGARRCAFATDGRAGWRRSSYRSVCAPKAWERDMRRAVVIRATSRRSASRLPTAAAAMRPQSGCMRTQLIARTSRRTSRLHW
jgi:hypothetical protein